MKDCKPGKQVLNYSGFLLPTTDSLVLFHTRDHRFRLYPCLSIIATTALPSYSVTDRRIAGARCSRRIICCCMRTWTSRAHSDCTWLSGRTRGIRRTSCQSRGFRWPVGIKRSLGPRITTSPETDYTFRLLCLSETRTHELFELIDLLFFYQQITHLITPHGYIASILCSNISEATGNFTWVQQC